MIKDSLQQVFRANVLRLRFIRENNTMPEHIVADGLDVLRRDVAAAVQESLPLGSSRQEDCRARAGAVLHIRSNVESLFAGAARGMHHVNDIALDLVIDVELVDGPAI